MNCWCVPPTVGVQSVSRRGRLVGGGVSIEFNYVTVDINMEKRSRKDRLYNNRGLRF